MVQAVNAHCKYNELVGGVRGGIKYKIHVCSKLLRPVRSQTTIYSYPGIRSGGNITSESLCLLTHVCRASSAFLHLMYEKNAIRRPYTYKLQFLTLGRKCSTARTFSKLRPPPPSPTLELLPRF